MVEAGITVTTLTDYRNAIACLINAERTSRGIAALTENNALDKAAVAHAAQAQRLKWWTGGANPHVNPETGSTIDSRIKAAGYCGGNPSRTSEIAYTWAGDQATPVGAVNWWMNISTSGHREAILNPEIKELGIGISNQVADRNVQPQAMMGTYVVDFGACAASVAPPSGGAGTPGGQSSTGTILKQNPNVILKRNRNILERP